MAAAKKKRKPNAAFMKPVQPDTALSAVVGNKPIPRTEVTKKLWAYIKKNGLQDKKKRTNINADDKLQSSVRRQENRHDVRDDQAGQQARQVSIANPKFCQGQEHSGASALGLCVLALRALKRSVDMQTRLPLLSFHILVSDKDNAYE